MSAQHPENQARQKQDNQGQSGQPSDSQLDQQRERFYRVYSDIGEYILLVITGAIFLKLCRRMSLLLDGAWLPGLGDCKVIAALTDKSDRSIEDFVSDNPKTKYRFGKQVYYRFSDILTTDDSSAKVNRIRRSGGKCDSAIIPDGIYTRTQVEQSLGIGGNTLTGWIDQFGLGVIQPGTTKQYFLGSDLIQFMVTYRDGLKIARTAKGKAEARGRLGK